MTSMILIAFAVISPVKVQNMILGGGVIRSGGKTKYVMMIDMIGTFSNPLRFETYDLDSKVADLFERKMKVTDTDVCGYAKGYVVRYNRENKERQTLIYMYNDKLYPVEDVLFCEEEE